MQLKLRTRGWVPFEYACGSGGGPSLIVPEPFYQLNVVPKLNTLPPASGLLGTPVHLNGPHRVTPDIAMLADPDTGFMQGQTLLIGTPPVEFRAAPKPGRLPNTANPRSVGPAWPVRCLPEFWHW